jgi:ABC-type transporter Mla subunit MlaD
MNQTVNKDELNDVLSQLSGTVDGLNNFLNKIKDKLPEDQKEKINAEISKAQADLSKAVGDISNLKL